jgi:hypothetical protein
MRAVALAFVLVTVAGCGSPAETAADAADRVTKAVLADDVDAVSSSFATPLQGSITRAEVGSLSDTMTALGAYKGVTYESSDPSKHEYVYRADFDRGSMGVVVRIDGSGKLDAYRVFPQRS